MSIFSDHRTACVRIPDFPLQALYHQKRDWRGKRVTWLEQLKPDAPLRYLSPEAEVMGLRLGMRYSHALGLVPDLLAGTSSETVLRRHERGLLKILHRFTPSVSRGSVHLVNGLYRLDVVGLGPAFRGLKRWAERLVAELSSQGWESRVVVGYTPFACEVASYRVKQEQPYFLFQGRSQEMQETLSLPLGVLGLSPDQVRRLARFKILSLEQFLALDSEEIRCRFGADIVEFYFKAGQALLERFEALPPEEPIWGQFGLPEPVDSVGEILTVVHQLFRELIPRLLRREEAVGQMLLGLCLEDGKRLQERLTPSFPTVDSKLLEQLLTLRLERFFARNPLGWGQRIERIVLVLVGEPDAEKQGELFSSWDLAEQCPEAVRPRDRQAALWALSRLRAEYGEECLCRAVLRDHRLPGRDFSWEKGKESLDWLGGVDSSSPPTQDARVRRILSTPVPLLCRDRWQDKEGPYLVDGGWWEETPYHRLYYFAFQTEQTGWLYWDEVRQGWFAQGWLQ